MDFLTELPQPRTVESFPAGYDYRSRYGAFRQYACGEGGGVYLGDADGGYAVIADEGSLADLLDIADTCITVYTFASAEDRDRYCDMRYGPLRAIGECRSTRQEHKELG